MAWRSRFLMVMSPPSQGAQWHGATRGLQKQASAPSSGRRLMMRAAPAARVWSSCATRGLGTGVATTMGVAVTAAIRQISTALSAHFAPHLVQSYCSNVCPSASAYLTGVLLMPRVAPMLPVIVKWVAYVHGL